MAWDIRNFHLNSHSREMTIPCFPFHSVYCLFHKTEKIITFSIYILERRICTSISELSFGCSLYAQARHEKLQRGDNLCGIDIAYCWTHMTFFFHFMVWLHVSDGIWFGLIYLITFRRHISIKCSLPSRCHDNANLRQHDDPRRPTCLTKTQQNPRNLNSN